MMVHDWKTLHSFLQDSPELAQAYALMLKQGLAGEDMAVGLAIVACKSRVRLLDTVLNRRELYSPGE